MTKVIAVKTDQRIARPLGVLIPLIREDIRDGEEAGVPYFIAAGEKLLEAKPQVKERRLNWEKWVERNFDRKLKSVQVWMRLAKKSRARSTFRQPRSLSEFQSPSREPHHQPKWHAPIKEAIKRAQTQSERLEDESTSKHALAVELIDIGFRVLASKLHPDKGSKNGDAMQRLNEVRATLKRLATHEWQQS